jgi:hypothetical protein
MRNKMEQKGSRGETEVGSRREIWKEKKRHRGTAIQNKWNREKIKWW